MILHSGKARSLSIPESGETNACRQACLMQKTHDAAVWPAQQVVVTSLRGQPARTLSALILCVTTAALERAITRHEHRRQILRKSEKDMENQNGRKMMAIDLHWGSGRASVFFSGRDDLRHVFILERRPGNVECERYHSELCACPVAAARHSIDMR